MIKKDIIDSMNTLEKGTVRTIIFKEGDTFHGVALEFNIVIEADSPELAAYELNQAIIGYVEAAAKSSIRTTHVLNQTPAKEYEELWQALESKKATPSPSPYQVYSYGRQLTY